MCKASCWDCNDFYIGKTKRRLHDRKSEHFKALIKSCQASAVADHITSTGQNIKWNHFEILATGRLDVHCKIKETLLIKDLKPALNENVGSETLFLYYFFVFFQQTFTIVIVSFQSFSLALLYYIQPSLLRMYVKVYETVKSLIKVFLQHALFCYVCNRSLHIISVKA